MTAVFPTAIQNKLSTGEAIQTEVLFHIVGRNRTTGAPETLSLWTGEGDRVFNVGGVNRTYLGGGALIDVPPVTYEAGLAINYVPVTISAAFAPVRTAFFTHDMKFGGVEIHVAVFAVETGLFVGLWRAFKGSESESDLPRASVGGDAVYEIKCATSARLLTLPSNETISDSTMQESNPGDGFRKFATQVASVRANWRG